MFDGISAALSAWREVLHVSEWTGLSVGALAGLAFAVYLDPALLRIAIKAAIVIAIGYAGVLYGNHVGRADVEAQWADARKAAIAATADRDQMTELELERTYQPQLIALQKESDANKETADAYEKQILGLLAKPPKGAPAVSVCELGTVADRVRRPK
jgi:hypothetical protein